SAARTRARPRSVISSGSPGPAPTSATLIAPAPSTPAPARPFPAPPSPRRRARPPPARGSTRALGVGVEVLLDPGTDATQLVGELLVLEADLLGEPVAQMLRERGRGAARRDGDGDRPAPVQRREDERAALRDVLDVAEDPPLARVGEDAFAERDVDHDDEPDVVELRRLVLVDDDDLGSGCLERAHLLLRAADDEHATAGQVETGDVVLRQRPHAPVLRPGRGAPTARARRLRA